MSLGGCRAPTSLGISFGLVGFTLRRDARRRAGGRERVRGVGQPRFARRAGGVGWGGSRTRGRAGGPRRFRRLACSPLFPLLDPRPYRLHVPPKHRSPLPHVGLCHVKQAADDRGGHEKVAPRHLPPKVPSAAEGENGQYPPPAPTGPYRPDPSKAPPTFASIDRARSGLHKISATRQRQRGRQVGGGGRRGRGGGRG